MKTVRGQPELNRWPLDLQSNALPLSYTPNVGSCHVNFDTYLHEFLMHLDLIWTRFDTYLIHRLSKHYHIHLSIDREKFQMLNHSGTQKAICGSKLPLWVLGCEKVEPPAGLEPAIPGLGGRCLIHWATEAIAYLPRKTWFSLRWHAKGSNPFEKCPAPEWKALSSPMTAWPNG